MAAMVTPTGSVGRPAWQADVRWERRFYTVTAEIPVVDVAEARELKTGEAVPGDRSAKFRALKVEIERTPGKQIVKTLHSAAECFVDMFNAAGVRIRFRVNRRKGRSLTFTDPREQWTGTAGTRGPWGTLPEQPPGKPRSLTPTAFREEVARLIGAERAEEIVRELMA
jgi:hypothetical protein